MGSKQKEIPPLSKIVDSSLKEILALSPSLSFPDILIAGAKPLDRYGRSDSEIREISDVARGKLRELRRAGKKILLDIVNALYKNENFADYRMEDYLSKYEFLISQPVIPDEVLKSLSKRLRDQILGYRNLVRVYRQKSSGRVTVGVSELKRLEGTPVDLDCLFHLEYSGREPHVIILKTKSPARIAGKIPYKMIDDYRKREGRTIEGGHFKKCLDLEDGITRDNVGLQFVTLSDNESYLTLKPNIVQSGNIEVLGMDDYVKTRDGPYRAVHIDAGWNPKRDESLLSRMPHVDSVEIILIGLLDCIMSNFGPGSYWRRMIAQEKGIVQKNLKNGRLQINYFTEEERQWKEMVQNRIVRILEYK